MGYALLLVGTSGVVQIIRNVILVDGHSFSFNEDVDYSCYVFTRGVKSSGILYQGLFSIKAMRDLYKPLFF